MLGVIEENYKNSVYFKKYFENLKFIIQKDTNRLINLNLELIKLILNIYKIKINVVLSSELNLQKKKFDLIKEILKKQEATTLITTSGVKEYFPKKNLDFDVLYFQYNDKIEKYEQQFGNFVSNLSIIDLLFNCGENGRRMLEKNLCLKRSNDF